MKKFPAFFIFLALAFPLYLSGQLTGITLAFTAEDDQQHLWLDSIYIENLTRGTDTTIFYPDTVFNLYVHLGTGEMPLPGHRGIYISHNYPNPFQGYTHFYVSVDKDQDVVISVNDLAGRNLAACSNSLKKGGHQFDLTPGRPGVFLIQLAGKDSQMTRRVICSGINEGGKAEITYRGSTGKDPQLRSTGTTAQFVSTIGDLYRFTGYAKTGAQITGSDMIEDIPFNTRTYVFDISEGIPCREFPQLTYEGKIYNTVQIGQQCWMRENLDVGAMIWAGERQDDNSVIEKYCYNNDPLQCDLYGGLYQWPELMGYTIIQGQRGICPEGWHIPSINEWEVLAGFLGGYEESGEKLKEAGNEHWIYNFISTGNNSSGFTALPGGVVKSYNVFEGLGMFANFWSSTYFGEMKGLQIKLSFDDPGSLRTENWMDYGFSVRCLHNRSALPVIRPVQAYSIYDTSAYSGGDIISEGGAPVTARGVCWSLDYYPTIEDSHTVDGSGTGAYTSFMDSLTPGKKYYYAAYATNEFGTSYAIVQYFTTPVITLPDVYTDYIEDITTSTAVSGGTVFTNWNLYAMGVCWNTEPNPTVNDFHTFDGSEPGVFTCEITGLDSNRVYYVRAYATNKAGTAYGGQRMMITRSGITTGTPCPDMPTVIYEGKTYHTVQIGDQCWFKENLDVGTKVSGNVYHSDNGILEKYCFYNHDEYCTDYGGLYLWNEMMNYTTGEGARGICPEGWHIPSNAEWNQLVDYLGGNDIAGGTLKETSTAHWFWPNAGATDSVGFSARPGGYRLMNEHPEIGWFFSAEYDAYYWTSTPGYWGAQYWIMTNIYPSIGGNSDVLNVGYSVRCVRD
jgi:uncharacterized protein (TIGR02145 family)